METAKKEETLQECACRHKYRDPEEEKDLIRRLNRIEGQVRGIKSMVQDDRYCTDILVQVSGRAGGVKRFLQGSFVQPYPHLRGGGHQKRQGRRGRCRALRDHKEDDVMILE